MTGFVPVVSAPLPAIVPGIVPGVVGDTGVSVGAGTINGAVGVLGLKIGGGGGGAPMAPIWASAAPPLPQIRRMARANDIARFVCMTIFLFRPSDTHVCNAT